MSKPKITAVKEINEDDPHIFFYNIEVEQDEVILECPTDGTKVTYQPPKINFTIEHHYLVNNKHCECAQTDEY